MHERALEFRARAQSAVGFLPELRELPAGTRTAQDAADAIGCSLEQIVKSMVMAVDDELVLVLTSGTNRVDGRALADALGRPDASISPADPDVVRARLGWSIGGVPPFAHDEGIATFVDPDLLDHEEVWAGGGTPKAVFPIDPARLVELTEATELDVFA